MAATLPLQRRPGCAPSTSASTSSSSSSRTRSSSSSSLPSPAARHLFPKTPRAMARHAHLQQQPQQPPQHQPMGPASLPAASAAAAPRRRRSNAAARRRAPTAAAAASAASADPSWGGDKAPDTSAVPADLPPAPEGLDQPYPRRHERDPRRLLGVDPDASFEEIQDARNFLSERHRGHAPSREAIELAFDALLQAHLADRARRGFAPPAAPGRRGAAAPRRAPPAGLAAVAARFRALWDPTVTARTVVNEGSVFAALAVWALFAGEQSFPTVAAVAYCIYQFKAKRVKRDPEGPFFVNSPMAGAVLSSACCLAVAVGAGTVLAPALQVLVQSAQEQQARTFVAIATLGALGIALK